MPDRQFADIAGVRSHPTLEQEIEQAINRHSAENGSNTQDFILAEYLMACLTAFDRAVNERERMCGRRPNSTANLTASGAFDPVMAYNDTLIENKPQEAD